jgi:hypothetical protein
LRDGGGRKGREDDDEQQRTPRDRRDRPQLSSSFLAFRGEWRWRYTIRVPALLGSECWLFAHGAPSKVWRFGYTCPVLWPLRLHIAGTPDDVDSKLEDEPGG